MLKMHCMLGMHSSQNPGMLCNKTLNSPASVIGARQTLQLQSHALYYYKPRISGIFGSSSCQNCRFTGACHCHTHCLAGGHSNGSASVLDKHSIACSTLTQYCMSNTDAPLHVGPRGSIASWNPNPALNVEQLTDYGKSVKKGMTQVILV